MASGTQLKHAHPILEDKLLLKNLFESADVNHDGFCSATEWADITATLNELASLADCGIRAAFGLGQWLHDSHTHRCNGGPVDTPAAALLIGPPAAGKTCLMSQVRASLVSPWLVSCLRTGGGRTSWPSVADAAHNAS